MNKHRTLWIVLPLMLVSGMLAAFAPLPAAATTLTDAEADGLAFLREEEKLAHDLYRTLYDQYALPVFANIARREGAHMEAMLTLLEAYGLSDPAQGMAAGKFTDPVLQSLYDDLLAQARQSAGEAVRVAALVEETDILDLRERLAPTTRPDIVRTYQNLLQASARHLRAFAMQVERQTGEEYLPALLSASDYAELTGGAQPGGPGGGGGRPW